MTLEEFQKWAEAKSDSLGTFSDESDGGMSLDDKGLESLLLQAFLLGQGATSDTVTLLTEQHERIEKLSRKHDASIDKMHRPHPETVVDTIAEALTALFNRVDAIDNSLTSVATELEGKASASALTILTSTISGAESSCPTLSAKTQHS
jgi:hypothetical protein